MVSALEIILFTYECGLGSFVHTDVADPLVFDYTCVLSKEQLGGVYCSSSLLFGLF